MLENRSWMVVRRIRMRTFFVNRSHSRTFSLLWKGQSVRLEIWRRYLLTGEVESKDKMSLFDVLRMYRETSICTPLRRTPL